VRQEANALSTKAIVSGCKQEHLDKYKSDHGNFPLHVMVTKRS